MPFHYRKDRGVQKHHNNLGPDRDIIKIVIWASVIIIFSIVLNGSIAYLITKNEVVTKLKNHDLVNIAESISYKIDSRIDKAKESSLILAKDPQIRDWIVNGERDYRQKEYALKKIRYLVSDFQYNNSFIVSAITNHYWDENGQIIDTIRKNDPDDEWFFKTLNSPEPVSISFDYNQERKDTYVFINAKMYEGNRPIAITGVGLGLADLASQFKTIKYGNHSDLWLVDQQGTIYLSDDLGDGGKNIKGLLPSQVSYRLLQQMAEGMKFYTLEYKNGNQLTDIIIYPLKSTQWYLLFQIPRAESVSFLKTIQLNTLFASIIILVFIVFLFHFITNKFVNPYKKAKELNRELEKKVLERTKELHDKNTKIMDSIDYAKRIQNAILPSEENLGQILRDYFLIWMPRDTVGGDFYWVKKVDQGYYIAVGDCTGHGVPGALMSMISISALNQTVNNDQDKPSVILKKMNQFIKQTLKQKNSNSLTDDGLDIGLCYFDGNHTLTYAGARISLYIRNNKELKIIRGNRKSIGYIKTSTDYVYTDTEMFIHKDDLFYMITDGYTDQNGGLKDHCFGKKRFIELINQYYQESLSDQREIFLQEIDKHMGNEPQRDDITLMGFKLI